MHLLFILVVIFVGASQAAKENHQSELWTSFKRTHEKEYANAQEEQHQ
jgi:hypothetical protein